MRLFCLLILACSSLLAQSATAQLAATKPADYSATAPLAKVSVTLVEAQAPNESMSANWSVLAYVPDHVGRHPVYATITGASPLFELPEGRYLILAERQGSSVRMYLEVASPQISSPEPQNLTLLWRP